MNLDRERQGHLKILEGGITPDLYDLVVLGEDSIARTKGLAYHPSGEELQIMVDSFFNSAQKRENDARSFIRKPKNVKISSSSKRIKVDQLNRALARSGLTKEQIPDIRAGFRGILSNEPDTTKEQKQLAIDFTKGLFPKY